MTVKTISGVCEITTGAYAPVTTPPIYQDEVDTCALSIDMTEDGDPYTIPGTATAWVKFLFEGNGTETAEVQMAIDGDNVSVDLGAVLTAIPGSPQAIIRLIDGTENLVTCKFPLTVVRTKGTPVTTYNDPEPSATYAAILASETARANAESARVTAEGLRVTAEGLRVTAEEGRESASATAVDNAEAATESANAAAAAAQSTLAGYLPQATASGASVSIYPQEGTTLAVEVQTVAAQAGSGTASPENIREITGYDAVEVAGATLTPVATLYGVTGAEDTIDNAGAVTHKTVLETLDGTGVWSFPTSNGSSDTHARFFRAPAQAMPTAALGISNMFPWVNAISGTPSLWTECAGKLASSGNLQVVVLKSRLTGWSDGWTAVQKANAFKAFLAALNTAGTPVRVVYERTTAATEANAATEILAAAGENVISADVGTVTVVYSASIPKIIDDYGDQLVYLDATIRRTWSGKKWTAMGTSITNRNQWEPPVVAATGLVFTNCGVDSSRVAGEGETAFWTTARIDAVKASDPDILTIEGGTNDLPHSTITLGDTSQLTAAIGDKDMYTFYGAYSYLIETLLAWKPTIIIVPMTTPYAVGNGVGLHGDYTFSMFAEAVRIIADYYGLPCIDLWRCGFNAFTYGESPYDIYSADEVHPNEAGGKQIAKEVLRELLAIAPIES